MNFNFFSRKAVGFSICDEKTVSYVFIELKKKQIQIIESHKFDLYCKPALHRLQQLLDRWPNASFLDSKKIFTETGPANISSYKEKKLFVKNKIEALQTLSPCVVESRPFAFLKKRPFFFCALKSSVDRLLFLLKEAKLVPLKVLAAPDALVTLHSHFFPKSKSGKFLVLTQNSLEIVEQSKEKPLFFFSIPLRESPTKVIKALEKLLKKRWSQKVEVDFVGDEKSEVYTLLNKASFVSLKTSPTSVNSSLLCELGAALSSSHLNSPSFFSPSLKRFFLSFRRDFLLQGVFALTLFLTSSIFWSAQIRIQKDLQHNFIEQSAKTLKAPFSSVSAEALRARLNKYPLKNFAPQAPSLTQSLKWITLLAKKARVSSKDTIQLESFLYTLSTSPQDKGAKVSLAFKSNSSESARKFYSLISQDREMVSRRKKINHSFQGEVYRLDFFLKPKPYLTRS